MNGSGAINAQAAATFQRLTQVLQSAETIEFDDRARLIFFSDLHRGVNDWADDFAPNQQLYFNALQYYYQEGFTCFELGDSDELWENQDFNWVKRSHSHIFWLLRQFYQEGRYYLLYGNHTMVWEDPVQAQKDLGQYYDDRTHRWEPLFDRIKVHEGLILHHRESGQKLFLVHGHQGDLTDDRLWPLSRLAVRLIWRHLQLLGLRNPTSSAQNITKQDAVENRFTLWVQQQGPKLAGVFGHTHRPAFPQPDAPPYFNAGSGVHPRAVTGIEVQRGEITLIKWWTTPDKTGALYIRREVLAGPRPLREL